MGLVSFEAVIAPYVICSVHSVGGGMAVHQGVACWPVAVLRVGSLVVDGVIPFAPCVFTGDHPGQQQTSNKHHNQRSQEDHDIHLVSPVFLHCPWKTGPQSEDHSPMAGSVCLPAPGLLEVFQFNVAELDLFSAFGRTTRSVFDIVHG